MNDKFSFTFFPAFVLVTLTVLVEYIRKADHEEMSVMDWCFGFDLMISAIIAAPAASAFRIAKVVSAESAATALNAQAAAAAAIAGRVAPKSVDAASTSSPYQTLAWASGGIACLFIVLVLLARIDGRRRAKRHQEQPPRRGKPLVPKPKIGDIVIGVLIPNALGILAIVAVFFFSTQGGKLGP